VLKDRVMAFLLIFLITSASACLQGAHPATGTGTPTNSTTSGAGGPSASQSTETAQSAGVPGPQWINFTEYFPTNPGHYTLYRITDNLIGLNYTVEAVFQRAPGRELLLTFTGVNGTGDFIDASLIGVRGLDVYFTSSSPPYSVAAHWLLIYLPIEAEDNTSWTWNGIHYHAVLVGNMTVGGIACRECVRLSFESHEAPPLNGNGVVYLSKGRGMVWYSFNGSDGERFRAVALDVRDLSPRTVEGTLTMDGVHPAGGYEVQLSPVNGSPLNSVEVDSHGRFKLRVFFNRVIALWYGRPVGNGSLSTEESRKVRVWRNNVNLSMGYPANFTRASFTELRSTESWKELVRSIHLGAWKRAAMRAGELPRYKYAIYESRTLAVDHPEIYLQADELFNELLTTHPGMWDYYLVRTDSRLAERRAFARISRGMYEGRAGMFSWEKFHIARFKPVGYREIYYNTSAFLPFIDDRLYFLGSALKAADWRAPPLSMAEFLYFKYRAEGRNPYLVVTGNGSAFVACESGGVLKLVRYDGNVVKEKPKNVVLIFNDRYVWYPLMGRNDTSKDPGLAEVVKAYATRNNLPNLTADEWGLVRLLQRNTELNNETDRLWATYFAARLHGAAWPYYPRVMRELYPHEYRRAENGPGVMYGKNAYVALISDELSPGTAVLAALAREFSNESLDTMMNIVFNRNLGMVLGSVNLKLGGFYLWFKPELFFMTTDDSFLAHGGNCIMMATSTMAVLALADIPGLEFYMAGMMFPYYLSGHAYVAVFRGGEYGTVSNLAWENGFNGLNYSRVVFLMLMTPSGWVLMEDWPPYTDGMVRTTFDFSGLVGLFRRVERLAPGARIARYERIKTGWKVGGVPITEFARERLKPDNVVRYPW